MKHLLLLAAAFLLAPAASAQWSFDGFFPSDDPDVALQNHGIAVAPNGNVWIQSYYPFTGDSVRVDPLPEVTGGCSVTSQNCRVTAIHVFDPSGNEVSYSPLSIVRLPGGEQDTLGGEVVLNAEGQTRWSWKEGTGLRAGPDGNIVAAIGKRVVKFNSMTGEVMAISTPSTLLSGTNAGPGIDGNGNVYMTGTFPGDPLAIFSGSDLEFIENVTSETGGFNRVVIALPDGNTAILPNYDDKVGTIYSREDDLSPWDSTGIAFDGLAVESYAIHPTTGNLWISSGSPNDQPEAPYLGLRWYEFTVEDILSDPTPTPQDSIVWNNPPDVAAALQFRPRGIAFSPDGRTAYVGAFNRSEPSVQKFMNQSVAVVPGPGIEGVTLHQNEPNPFTGSTTIRFDLAEGATVRLRVFDTLGRTVATLADGPLAQGPHAERFDGSGLAAGVYTFVLEVDGRALTGRMALTR